MRHTTKMIAKDSKRKDTPYRTPRGKNLRPAIAKGVKNAFRNRKTHGEFQWIVAQRSSTYNTWIQTSRLQNIYHNRSLKLRSVETLDGKHGQQGRDLTLVAQPRGRGVKHCLASVDSDLEVLSRNPTDGSFAVLACQLAAFNKCMNEVILSY